MEGIKVTMEERICERDEFHNLCLTWVTTV